ncbi:MAG: GLPGLI family protein [Bacteroidetes bacterium]|nr:MAG: GLPGLI family protein [Bacteroidota bacterium]
MHQKILWTLVCLMALFTFLHPTALSGQEMEGEIRYLVVHNWAKKMASLDYLSQQQRDKVSYMWGGSDSEWKVYTTLYFSPTKSKYEDSEEKAEPDAEGYSWRKDAYMIIRDFQANTIFDHVTMLGRTWVVEDSIQTPEWKILNDMKEVAGHVCMNAIMEDTVKRQKIVAWFALDMPVPAGPERLMGLPGIILEADVNNGAETITADRIQLKKLTGELDLPKKVRGRHISEKDYREKIREHLEQKREAEEPWFWGMRYMQ